MALECATDLSVRFLLTYPDLEWTENAVDMRILSKKGIDFMRRVLDSKQQDEVHSPSSNVLLQVSTPRIANKEVSDVAVKV